MSVNFFLVEGYGKSALQKVLHIAPFVERFKTATLGSSSGQILPVLKTNYLTIGFLLNFC